MNDDKQTIALGLRAATGCSTTHREYQHRLFLSPFSHRNPRVAEDFFQETWVRILEAAT